MSDDTRTGGGLLRRWELALRRVQATKLILLPSLTGALAGLVTIAFVELVNLVQWLAIGSTDLPLHVLPGVPWYRILLVPVLGGLIVGPLVHPKIWRPVAGGLILGLMILAVRNLSGVGYATMDGALSGTWPWTWLAVLLPAKMVATSLTLSAGGSGGVFLPSLYIGSVLGGLYGCAAHELFPHATAGSGAYALVGMAGVLSAATHSPITALILLFELTGDYEIILPVMIVTTLATLVGRALMTDSIYTLKFSRRGIALHRREDLVMRSHTVREIMRPPAGVIDGRTPIGTIVQCFLDHETTAVYVVDPNARLTGVISIHHIQAPDVRNLGPLVVAQDIAEPNVHVVAPVDTLADCMEHFVQSENDELPVVDPGGQRVGLVSRRDVLRLYATELLRHEYVGMQTTDADLGGRQIRLAEGFTLDRVPVPAWLAGRSLRAADLRVTHNLTVVGLRTRESTGDRLPDPDEALHAGDLLVVAGPPAAIDRFRRASATSRRLATDPR